MALASFLVLPVELRLKIYEHVYWRPCPIYNANSFWFGIKTIKDLLSDVDTSLLLVSKQVYTESLAVALRCNTFYWPSVTRLHYSRALRCQLSNITSILLDTDVLSEMAQYGYGWPLLTGLKEIIVNVYVRQWPAIHFYTWRSSWTELLLQLQAIQSIVVKVLVKEESLADRILGGKFHLLTQAKSEDIFEFPPSRVSDSD